MEVKTAEQAVETAVQGAAEDAKRRFSAGEFEGPLDLLWFLIHKSEINIYDIPIAEITEQYLEYLDFAVQTDLGDLSEFYKWAAMLLNMKSRMLLPVEISYDDDVEDPRQELVEKLIEYQKFKKLSELMEEKENAAEWNFERSKIQRVLPFEEGASEWEQIDTWDLLQQMQKIFKTMVSSYSNEKILNMYEEISVNEKITLMNEILERKSECMFSELLTRAGNEMDVICAFMAILEAVKFKLITIFQNKLFGDIKLCRRAEHPEPGVSIEVTVDRPEFAADDREPQ
ncbi:MAG: segregation/condensation protein A [Treponemataceae bacterium]|nr:segregation/condensation protein A [Treponemataceae bacterium]